MITKAVQIQLQHLKAPKWRPSSLLAEVAKNRPKSAMGGTWVGERGGGVSPQLILITWPQAVRKMRGVGGGRGERRGDMGQITAHSNPHSSFSLSFFPLCVRRGFDEKILHLAVQYRYNIFATSVTVTNSRYNLLCLCNGNEVTPDNLWSTCKDAQLCLSHGIMQIHCFHWVRILKGIPFLTGP